MAIGLVLHIVFPALVVLPVFRLLKIMRCRKLVELALHLNESEFFVGLLSDEALREDFAEQNTKQERK